MHLLTLGLNHTTAPLAVRERVAFVPEEVCTTIGRLREKLSEPSNGRVSEAAIVSTCNRTELYCAAEEPDRAQRALAEFVALVTRLNRGRAFYATPERLGEYVLVECTVQPNGFVAAAHVHPKQTERFEIESGTVAFKLDGEEIVARVDPVEQVAHHGVRIIPGRVRQQEE